MGKTTGGACIIRTELYLINALELDSGLIIFRPQQNKEKYQESSCFMICLAGVSCGADLLSIHGYNLSSLPTDG
jgi:hypothetical protein